MNGHTTARTKILKKSANRDEHEIVLTLAEDIPDSFSDSDDPIFLIGYADHFVDSAKMRKQVVYHITADDTNGTSVFLFEGRNIASILNIDGTDFGHISRDPADAGIFA